MTPNWDHIVIHHSATADSESASWAAIRRFHTGVQHWDDIGYHFGIEKIGEHYEVLVGRPLDVAGAHTKENSMNRRGIGICFVGDFDKTAPAHEMLVYAADYIVVPMMRYHHVPLSQVHPHRKHATYKSCPGTLFPWDPFVTMLRDRLTPPVPPGATT